MTRHLFHRTILGLVVVTTATTVGCSTRWIDVTPSQTNRENPVTQSILNDERVPLVMDGFHMTQNGAPQNPSTEVEHRILNTVQETRLFSTLIPLGGNVASLGDKVVTARITFDETVDSHSGKTAWKGFVIGASMFLLSPVIDLDYDYAAEAQSRTRTLGRPDKALYGTLIRYSPLYSVRRHADDDRRTQGTGH